jgi:hypothetical protein
MVTDRLNEPLESVVAWPSVVPDGSMVMTTWLWGAKPLALAVREPPAGMTPVDRISWHCPSGRLGLPGAVVPGGEPGGDPVGWAEGHGDGVETVELEVAAPKIVPVSWASVGLVVLVRVTDTEAGGPAENVGPGSPTTACQKLPFHHCSVVPPFKLESTMVTLVKVLPEDKETSMNSPVPLESGATGSEEYWPVLTVPSPPDAVAVVPPLVDVAEPSGVVEVLLVQVEVPVGHVVPFGGLELMANEKLALSPVVSSVPTTECEPAAVPAGMVTVMLNPPLESAVVVPRLVAPSRVKLTTPFDVYPVPVKSIWHGVVLHVDGLPERLG